jgi:hypothetical protein
MKLTCQAMLIVFLLLWAILIAVALTRASRSGRQEHHRVAALSIRIEVPASLLCGHPGHLPPQCLPSCAPAS